MSCTWAAGIKGSRLICSGQGSWPASCLMARSNCTATSRTGCVVASPSYASCHSMPEVNEPENNQLGQTSWFCATHHCWPRSVLSSQSPVKAVAVERSSLANPPHRRPSTVGPFPSSLPKPMCSQAQQPVCDFTPKAFSSKTLRSKSLTPSGTSPSLPRPQLQHGSGKGLISNSTRWHCPCHFKTLGSTYA